VFESYQQMPASTAVQSLQETRERLLEAGGEIFAA
jgi:hypothetical protein